MMKKAFLLLSLSLFLSLLTFACGSPSTLESKNIPKWAISQPPLCGLGIYKYKSNFGTAKRFSIAYARVDLSEQVETKVRSMTSLYGASGQIKDEGFSEDLARLAAVNLSKTTINGSKPKKIQIVEQNIFSLVCLEPDVLTAAIKKMKILNATQKKYLYKKAKIAQQELRKQMETYGK